MNFNEFYDMLNDKLNTYHSKYITLKHIVPGVLYDNIDNKSKFIELLYELTKDKLYIKCLKKFDKSTVYHDYILPIAVFLHYMHIDIENLKQIDLFIVNRQIYEQYNPIVGGEYIQGVNTSKKHNVHVILVKQYNQNTKENKEKTLKSLFHELMHLIDNSDFNGLNEANKISYSFRWFEIKARAISKVFLQFYKGLNKGFQKLTSVFWGVRQSLRMLSNDIMHEINSNYYSIDLNLDDRYLLNENVDNLDMLSDNIQLLTSMQQINTLKNFITNFKERIEC